MNHVSFALIGILILLVVSGTLTSIFEITGDVVKQPLKKTTIISSKKPVPLCGPRMPFLAPRKPTKQTNTIARPRRIPVIQPPPPAQLPGHPRRAC